MNRRQFLGAALGAAAVFGGKEAFRGFAREAQQETFNYKKVSEAKPDEFIDVMQDNGTFWSAGLEFQIPSAVFGQSIVARQPGMFAINAANTAGLGVRINTRHINDYLQNGVRVGMFIDAETTVSGTPALDTSIVRVVQIVNGVEKTVSSVGMTNFAGVILPLEHGAVTQVRIDKGDPSHQYVVRFGPLSAQDSFKLLQSVIDTQNTEQSMKLPIRKFSDAKPDEPFIPLSIINPNTGTKRLWSRGVALTFPDQPAVKHFDFGNPGEMVVQTPAGVTNTDVYMTIDPHFIGDYKFATGGPEDALNRPTVFIKTKPGTLVQLLDEKREVVKQTIRLIDQVTIKQVQVRADDTGFAAIEIPEYLSTFGLRVVFEKPDTQQDTVLQFGPEKPADRGKPMVLDATQFIVRKTNFLPLGPQRAAI